MGKPLVLQLNGADFPLQLERVERSDLYGSIEIETLDEQGRRCTLATLADDGRTVIASAGTSFGMLSPDGRWVEKKALIPTDNQGNAIAAVPSSYSAPVPLSTRVSIDEYLSHNIRSVYQISSEADLGPLLAELKKGVIFQFPYSFRGGLEADAGFLIMGADGTAFIAIGTPTKLEFIGLEQAGALTEETESEDGDDTLDFNML